MLARLPRHRAIASFSFLFLSPEHAWPEERTREARPHGAADSQRLVRGAAREQQMAFPSSARRTASANGLLVVAFAAVASSPCCSPCLLLPRRRKRRCPRDVSRRASRGGGRGRAPGGQQQGLALRRHLFLFVFLVWQKKMLFLSTSIFSFHTSPFSLSLSPSLSLSRSAA